MAYAAIGVTAALTTGCAAPVNGHGSVAGGHRGARATAISAPAAGPGKSGKSGPSPSPAQFKVTNKDGSVGYSGVGALVWPAPRGARPSFSRQQALTALEKAGIAPEPLGVNGRVPSSLRLVEYENQFGARSPDGREIPSVPRQLAWFAEYDNLPPGVISVPVTLHTTSTLPAERRPWVAIAVVSATTGKILDGFSYST
jgi:hypothetical protein